MEPNKSYPLHPDHDDQASTPSTSSLHSSDNTILAPLSTFDQTQNAPTVSSKPVPWYLRPLAKTGQSPLTSTQTRPFVPREPLVETQQTQPAVPVNYNHKLAATQPGETNHPEAYVSPFRSQPLPPLPPPIADSSSGKSVYRPPTITQQNPLQNSQGATQTPKPFSQFGSMSRPLDRPSASKPRNTRRIAWIVIGVILVGVLSAGGYLLWQRSQSNSPAAAPAITSDVTVRERLYQAIEKHLQTRYVQQVYDQTTVGADTDVVRLDALSDFSNPMKPKSYIQYDVRSGEGDNAVQQAGEIIVLEEKEYYAKLTKSKPTDGVSESKTPKENQWYQIASADNIGETLLDPMSIRLGLNSSIGEVPVGNFSDSNRENLMRFIRERNVYAIKNSDDVTENNRRQTHYGIDFNPVLVNELNKKINDIIAANSNLATVNFTQNDVIDMEIWVDNESGRMIKIKFDREYATSVNESGAVKESITTQLTYPSDAPTIKTPVGAITGPWNTR